MKTIRTNRPNSQRNYSMNGDIMRLRIRDIRENKVLGQQEVANDLLCDNYFVPNMKEGNVLFLWKLL